MTSDNETGKNYGMQELVGKNIAHYTVFLEYFIVSRLEKDKLLITLSSGGIGLLVTLLSLTRASIPCCFFLLVISSFISFAVCISSSLFIFHINAEHIKNEIKGTTNNEIINKMKKHDKMSAYSFVFGSLLLFLYVLLLLFLNQWRW